MPTKQDTKAPDEASKTGSREMLIDHSNFNMVVDGKPTRIKRNTPMMFTEKQIISMGSKLRDPNQSDTPDKTPEQLARDITRAEAQIKELRKRRESAIKAAKD